MITFVGSDVDDTPFNSNDLTVTYPSIAVDDVCIAFGRAGSTHPLDMTLDDAEFTTIREDRLEDDSDRRLHSWYKVLDGTETSLTMSVSADTQHSLSIHVFRGVDPSTPVDAAATLANGTNNAADPQPAAITTVTDNSAVVLLGGWTHDDISAAGAPSGFTVGETVIGSKSDFRSQIVAYQLDVGTAGAVTPGAFSNTASPAGVADWAIQTIALRPAGAAPTTQFEVHDGATSVEYEVLVWDGTALVAYAPEVAAP